MDKRAIEYSQQIEANGAEFLIALGRAAGAYERNDEQIHWIIGNSPIDYHNAVVRLTTTAEQAAAAIIASRQQMQAQQVPGTWHVGPAMTPANIGALLMQQGFTYAGDEIGMAVDLAALPTAVPTPAGFTVRPVQTAQDLQIWVETLGQGFGEGLIEAEWVGEMYRRIGLDQADTWRHYVGYVQDQAVATATLFLAAGVAGIYFVMTVPATRRQGIGAAITLAALQAARQAGYSVGVLGSSAAGFPVYQRLGFQEYCRIGIYTWQPNT